MGKRDHRPKRRFRPKLATSPPPKRWLSDEPPPPILSSGLNDVPLWEKKFCSSVGLIPWWKVLDAKKFRHCHRNIVDWNDSAGEEAFRNAKERFWAESNGLPCDIRLPDPDSYIDMIDWNPYIDPELVSELDRVFVCPDDVRKGISKASDKFSQNPGNCDNPWDSYSMGCRETFKIEATGWGGWGNCRHDTKNTGDGNYVCEYSNIHGNGAMKENEQVHSSERSRNWTEENIQSKDLYSSNNPWDLKDPSRNGAVKRLVWKDCQDKSKGWNSGLQQHNLSSRNEYGELSCTQGNGAKERPQKNPWGKSWDQKQGDNCAKLKNLSNVGEHRCATAVGALNQKTRRDKAWGWKQGDNGTQQLKPPDNAGTWVCSYHRSDVSKKTRWEDCCDKSRDLNQGENCTSDFSKRGCGNNPWDRSCRGGVLAKDKQCDNSADTWGHRRWGNKVNESRNWDSGGNPWECDVTTDNAVQKDGGWEAAERNHCYRKELENDGNNDSRKSGSRLAESGWEAWNGGCRKREGSLQYVSRYKSSRFQGDYQQHTGNKRRGNTKRVTFV